MRGDNSYSRLARVTFCGSPPHAWRQCQPFQPQNPPPRFTSTCVETIPSSSRRNPPRAVHLHMRGDNFFQFPPPLIYSVHLHMRGDNARECFCGTDLCRFTSTCVETIQAIWF